MKKHLTPALATQPCTGAKPSLQVEAMTGRGHVIARTVAEVPILFCLRCGSFTARRAYGLAATCRGRPTAPGAQALARIRRGIQPWQNRGATGRDRTHMYTEAWSAADGGFHQQGPAPGRGKRRRPADDPDTTQTAVDDNANDAPTTSPPALTSGGGSGGADGGGPAEPSGEGRALEEGGDQEPRGKRPRVRRCTIVKDATGAEPTREQADIWIEEADRRIKC